jgi:isopentenyldiphosphate isomerase
MMPEVLDIYDDSMRPIGTMDRDEAHRIGAWHKTFHCWIVRRDASGEYVLFQKRSASKRAHPNKLDITAAGHLTAGETVDDGIREVGEELGAQVTLEQLRFLGIRTAASISGTDVNREFNHVYLLHRDHPIRSYTLQQSEVTSLVQIRVRDGLDLCAGRTISVPASGVELDSAGVPHDIEINVSLADIIPRRDHYYWKIFIMAERHLAGNPDICI